MIKTHKVFANIVWTASGKVRSVTRTTGLNDYDLHFKYDPTGNRIVKMAENPEINSTSYAFYTKTYYLRDAQGNIMATYERKYLATAPDVLMTFSLTERSVYGSSRIANHVKPVLLVSFDETTDSDYVHYGSPQILSHTNGYKHFELTNHLGNVMAVVSDKRTPIITGSTITGYTPELLIAKDYYPFGMEMSGRYGGDNGTEPDDEYRFGFQNQEKDDEWTGQTGSHLNFKYRMYDARIGRFFAIDPLAAKYAYNSTYAFSENRVIDKIELEGLETSGIPLNTQPFNKNPEGLPVTKDYSMNSRAKLAIKGSWQVVAGACGTIGSVGYIVGTRGFGAVAGGLVGITVSWSTLYSGFRNLGAAYENKIDEAPEFENVAGSTSDALGALKWVSHGVDGVASVATGKVTSSPTVFIETVNNVNTAVSTVTTVTSLLPENSYTPIEPRKENGSGTSSISEKTTNKAANAVMNFMGDN